MNVNMRSICISDVGRGGAVDIHCMGEEGVGEVAVRDGGVFKWDTKGLSGGIGARWCFKMASRESVMG